MPHTVNKFSKTDILKKYTCLVMSYKEFLCYIFEFDIFCPTNELETEVDLIGPRLNKNQNPTLIEK